MKYTLTARELSNFFGQLGMLIHSGISVTEGLAILQDESQTDTDREITTALLTSMEETGSLTQAMETSGRFPHSSVSYIKTGEETGCLDEILNSLAQHYEQEQEVSEQIRSAVTYPLIMLGMMGIVIVVLLVKVLPVFQQVFQQMGMEMNTLSLGLLKAGSILSKYFPAIGSSPDCSDSFSQSERKRTHLSEKRSLPLTSLSRYPTGCRLRASCTGTFSRAEKRSHSRYKS